MVDDRENTHGQGTDWAIGRRSLVQGSLIGAVLLDAVLGGGVETAAADEASETVRVVVATNDAQGKSYFLRDEHVKKGGDIWRTVPAEPLGQGAAGDLKTVLPFIGPNVPGLMTPEIFAKSQPPVGGTRFTISNYPQLPRPKDRDSIVGWHRTTTLDLAVVLEGECVLVLDQGETTVRPGDIFILRNVRHAWQNYGNKPCRALAIQIGV